MKSILNVTFSNYGNYSNENYGTNSLCFTDVQGNVFYFSYKTLVAFRCQKGLFCIQNYWKTTTGKHLNIIEPDHEKRLTEEEFKAKYLECFGKTL